MITDVMETEATGLLEVYTTTLRFSLLGIGVGTVPTKLPITLHLEMRYAIYTKVNGGLPPSQTDTINGNRELNSSVRCVSRL